MSDEEPTYLDLVKTFDHDELSRFPSYAKLRQALSDLANEVGHSDTPWKIEDWIRAVQEMTVTAPYGDGCDCGRLEPVGRVAWPHAAQVEDGWLRGQYRCAECGAQWSCEYMVGYMIKC